MASLLSFTVAGNDAVKNGLTALLEQTKDLRPFWRDVFAPKYFAMVQDLFATGGRARGGGGKFKSGAWAQLSPRYRVWKQEHYPSRPLLVREGTMRESVNWHGSGLGPGGIFEATPSYAVFGTSVPYAKYHQYGTKNMPQRSFLPPPDPAVFAPLMQAWLQKKKGS